MSSCAQLSQRQNLLRNLYNHVHDPDLQAEYAQQIAQIEDQMTKQGCFATTQRTLTGTVTVCSPPYIPKANHDFTAHLSVLDNNGSIWWSFSPLTFKVGSVSQNVEVGADIGGFYDTTTGELDLRTPISANTNYGSATTELVLSTNISLPSSCLDKGTGTPISDPKNMNGTVELIGSATLQILGISADVFLHVSGTLS